MSSMRVENWCGYDIRFVEVDGEWMAILKDVCDALGLRTDKVAYRLDPDLMRRVPVEIERVSNRPTKYNSEFHEVPSRDIIKSEDHPSRGVMKSKFTVHMLAVAEAGIYQALFASRKLEARQFTGWVSSVLPKLRKNVGLEQYEVMRMTEPAIQEEINWMIDSLYWDEERNCVMQSITVQGGDVDQVPFE